MYTFMCVRVYMCTCVCVRVCNHVGDFIWCGYQDELPCFGKLFDILLIESTVIFCLCLYHTKGIDRHHNSFVINADPTHSKVIKIITDDDELNH